MTAPTIDRIRLKGEKIAEEIFALAGDRNDAATVATAEGLLNGISNVLVQRLGTERAFQTVARAADILDRVLLDGQWPVKPSICGNG